MKFAPHGVISKNINVKTLSAFYFGGKQILIQTILQFIQMTGKYWV